MTKTVAAYWFLSPVPMRNLIWGISILSLSVFDALSSPARAVGFDGDFFDASTWLQTCASVAAWENTYNCGYISNASSAQVNLGDPSSPEGAPFVSTWTNSPPSLSGARDSVYLVSFNLSVEYKTEEVPDNPDNPESTITIYTLSGTDQLPDPPVYGYYQIGGGTRLGNVRGGSSLGNISFYLQPSETLAFGLFTENTFISAPDDASLFISNFSATPYTAPTVPAVPAPLPAIGAASLFLGSRRLKRRINRQRLLRLARRNLAPAIRSVLPC